MSTSSSKIKSYNIYSAKCKLKKPIADATHTLTEISFLVLRLQLENGIIGESYLLSFQYSPNAILGALKDALPNVIGFEANQMGIIATKLEHNSEYFGNNGINKWAAAAINIAMWDAWSRTLNVPIWNMFGLHREKCAIYGSGGWLSYTADELIEEVSDYKNRGFKAVKIKVGSPDWQTDVERLKLVRNAVGNELNIMMDANQGMQTPQAIQLARKAAELNIYWFEEPLNHQNFDGYQSLKAQTGISLAMGEREYDTMPLVELAKRNAIDIWQPDILRIGGVDAWRDSAAIAAAYQIPVLPHYYKDYDVPLVCTIANGVGVESFDWIDTLIDNPMLVKDGYAYPHQQAGWGFRFLDEHLNEIK
ncbi:mandelate racemase/muconate lactonizing enzyme family protein [Pedobacter frigoris]|uniref:mandelate racemase/muconate lactonizing enzyme family protein n=1 Tax=Pedobacter frigoris TaxID=2571272 RepID=UPI00292E1711|nr:mandelate racemase/muconate lactonizing enzyme family protein [Pedobacter frigoris]